MNVRLLRDCKTNVTLYSFISVDRVTGHTLVLKKQYPLLLDLISLELLNKSWLTSWSVYFCVAGPTRSLTF